MGSRREPHLFKHGVTALTHSELLIKTCHNSLDYELLLT